MPKKTKRTERLFTRISPTNADWWDKQRTRYESERADLMDRLLSYARKYLRAEFKGKKI